MREMKNFSVEAFRILMGLTIPSAAATQFSAFVARARLLAGTLTLD